MTQPIAPAATRYLRADAIRGGMDLLMFAHKSHLAFTDDALATRRLGRAHHRILYMVSRRPGEAGTTLIDALGITKQSLYRVLHELTDQVRSRHELASATGERGSCFRPTRALSSRTSYSSSSTPTWRAYAAAGETAVNGYWSLMQHLMHETAHGHFLAFNAAPEPPPA